MSIGFPAADRHVPGFAGNWHGVRSRFATKSPSNFELPIGELTIGQDGSIGYVCHNRDEVELCITASFTFRVLAPAAAVELAVEQ